MADTARVRPIEYTSPRPFILTVCFIWGIGVGFGLNFFRAPQIEEQAQTPNNQTEAAAIRPVPSELERRRLDLPPVFEVDPTPAPVPSARQTLEEFSVEPPAAVLTTEGGITGRTAPPLGQARTLPGAPTQPVRPPTPAAPPPLPDLTP